MRRIGHLVVELLIAGAVVHLASCLDWDIPDDYGNSSGGEDCTNLFDDDGDGQVDCLDSDCLDEPVCYGFRESVCYDDIDNDGDGLIDCDDDDCLFESYCAWP